MGSPHPVQLGWEQRLPDGTADRPWRLADAPDAILALEAGWRARSSGRDVSATALAVQVNVNDDTDHVFGNSSRTLPRWRAVLDVRRAEGDGAAPRWPKRLSPAESASLAWLTVEGIRTARARYGPIHEVHLFIAAPAGFAVTLGTLLATLPTVVTYEYDARTGMYQRAAVLQP